MGYGSYSSRLRSTRAIASGFYTKPKEEIFAERSINNAMSPYGIGVRESRDSTEHPESLAIIIALDVTGSMGSVPHYLVKDGLPNIVDKIIKGGVPSPQVLFLGIGDHECDSAPLQVGQFESSDELLDKWLTSVYLEGGGGGNAGESYLLAWYFAAYHTAIDCFEKRGKKGFLFTIGDEPALEQIPSSTLKALMGPGQYEDYSAKALFEKASEKYNVFHVHISETYSGSRKSVFNHWKQNLQDRVIVAERHEMVSEIISSTVLNGSNDKQAVAEQPKAEKRMERQEEPQEEIIL